MWSLFAGIVELDMNLLSSWFGQVKKSDIDHLFCFFCHEQHKYYCKYGTVFSVSSDIYKNTV